jgi:ssDNA-binding Zn-finger/Zn-ribbon topoisomerase 1
VWGAPEKQDCPDCGALFLVVTNRKKGGRTLKCVSGECKFTKTESEV